MLFQVKLFVGISSTLLLAQIPVLVLAKKKTIRMLPSIADNFFSVCLTFDAVSLLASLAFLTRQAQFECGSTCFRILKFGSALRQLRFDNDMRPVFTSSTSAFMVAVYIGCYAGALYTLIRILSHRSREDQKRLSLEYRERFLVSSDEFALAKAVTCSEDPLISSIDGEKLFMFDHLCPWTGRYICGEKLLVFYAFLLFAALGSSLSLFSCAKMLYQQTMQVQQAFRGVNVFLVVVASVTSLGANQALVVTQLVLSFLVFLVTIVYVFYQGIVKLNKLMPTEIENKLSRCQQKVKQNALFFLYKPDGTFLQMLQPTFREDYTAQQYSWEQSLEKIGCIVSAEQANQLFDRLLRRKCGRIEKLKFLVSIK